MQRISKTKLGPPAELAIGQRDLERTIRRALMHPMTQETLEVMGSPLGRFDVTAYVDDSAPQSLWIHITKRPNPRPTMGKENALQILAHFAIRLGPDKWWIQLKDDETWVCRKRLGD